MRHVWIWMSMIAGPLAMFSIGCTGEPDESWAEDEEDVQEAQQALAQPDLIVDSFTVQDVSGGVLATVVIKNQGDAASPYMSTAYYNTRLYAPGQFGPGCYGGSVGTYTGPIAAGASKTFTFTIGGWTVAGIESCNAVWRTETDAINQVAESDETNNVKLGKD
jgi:VCBS repeat-containing protein